MENNAYIRFDWFMKHMLRDKSNFEILEGFISVLLGEDVKIEEILESEGNQESDDDKFNRVDIKAKNSKGHLIIVEVQLTRQLYYLQRILYGTCKAITEHINIGDKYDQVRKVYSISLLYCEYGSQTEVINGVRKAVGAIKTTLGPSGKCVAIHTSYGVDITRDGATVSKSISLKSQTEDIGAQLIRKAAENTERQAGDGTSSVSVLTEEMCIRGQKALKVGANVNEIKSGMIKAEKFVKDYIASQAIPVGNDLEKVRH